MVALDLQKLRVYNIHMKITPEQEARFWAKVDKAAPGECWHWTACRSKDGYGKVNLYGRCRPATHIALILDGRPRPEKLSALHHCDNPTCVNPRHLYWGDDAQNTCDKIARNRHNPKFGSEHQNSKLTEAQVVEILKSTETQVALAKKFGVTQGLIGHIRRRIAWSHIEGTANRVGHAKGAATGHAKVSPEIVREIRTASGFQREIAERYGVTQTLVSQIKRRIIWKHVD
jgi:predicted XRE-type DNA-binding protein